MKEEIVNLRNQAVAQITNAKSIGELESIRIDYLGKNGKLTTLIKEIKDLTPTEKKGVGILINETKSSIESLLAEQRNSLNAVVRKWFDPTVPGIEPKIGHTHLVSQAILKITEIFESVGFGRVRYPEVDWDYYAFSGLNFPANHPARDEWETFFIKKNGDNKLGAMLLTPHTSSGQIREMKRTSPPIRMINISKCYRRQSDTSHIPMFHQFEGLVIDKNISIVNLKGTIDYFINTFYSTGRKARLRPYHFQFTEPSFEIDITCDICKGTGCKLCKEGWLELGGAGMVHPNVLKAGKIDPQKYSGFAFGWGVERVLMMQTGLNIPDIRTLYSTNTNYLKQF